MNEELLTLGLHVGKFLVASGLLVLIYIFLIRDKASFNQSRLFLLTLPILALLFSQWTITIYSPPIKYVEIAAPASTSTPASNVETNSFHYNQSHNTAAVAPSETNANINGLSQLLNAKSVLLICVLIAFLFMVPAIWQCIQLLHIRSNGKVSVYKGFEVVTSSAIPTPFSFYKTIFVNENLKPKKQEIILKHESWHIKHRHYIDVFIIEFTTRLFWFNPLLWWVRKELRSVCEFQTDKSVLEDGQEIYTYQTLILEEVMGQSSFLANGFNNSFTKKRFITMKNNPNVRLNSLRRILLPFCMLLIFASLSFSIGKQQTKYRVKETGQQKVTKQEDSIHIQVVNGKIVAMSPLNRALKPEDVKVDSVAVIQQLTGNLRFDKNVDVTFQQMAKGLETVFSTFGKVFVSAVDTLSTEITTKADVVSTPQPTKEKLDKELNANNLQFDKLIQQPNNTNKIKKIKNFPSIKLNKSYSWRNFCNNRLAGYGQYIFNNMENGVYSGVQINSYWQTNWNVTGKFIGDAFVIHTPEPWNERWVGSGFDGKTIYGSFVLSGDLYSFEFDIIDTKKNDLLFQMNVKPNE